MSAVPESAPRPRLLVLCAGDPANERTFSGSARQLVLALERAGALHHAENVLGHSDPFDRGAPPLRALRRLDRFGVEDRYRWTRVCFERNSRRAERIAREHGGFNACLMYGTTFLPRLGVPTYCYFDATAAQVHAARTWEFARFGEGFARRIIASQAGVFAHCTGILPRSAWAAESVRRDYGVPEAKIVIAGAGPNFTAAPLPHAGYERKTVLFIGSEFERKGGPLIVEAFQRVRREVPDAVLRIVGSEPEVDGPGIEVLGRIDKHAPGGLERLQRLYSEASLFCIMSDFEPFGIVILEAQHAGVPCVVPARFAFTETVRDGETGRHVAEYDAVRLADTLVELLRDPEALARMGAAARAFAQREWTWDRAAERILARVGADLARVPAGAAL